jgi:hypothetical protein
MNLNVTKEQVLSDHLKSVKESGVFKNFTFSPTSRIFTLIRAISNAIYTFIDTDLIAIQKAIHPHTSEDADLHEHLISRGMEWKPALPAIHRIRIGSNSQPNENIPLPQGLIIHTQGNENERVRFFLQSSYILPAGVNSDSSGKYTIEGRAICVNSGSLGNVVQGAISEIENAPEGIDYVINLDVEPIQLGQFRETRTSVRSRIQTNDDVSTKWTPPWYKSEAEAFGFVKRAIFKSAKALGTDGEVKLLLQGSAGELTESQIQQVLDHFNSEDNDPGGVAHVIGQNVDEVLINKVINVKFASDDTIIIQEILDELKDEYFLSLNEGDDFIDAQLKSIYEELPNVILVEFTPPGNVEVPAGSIASPGESFQVIGSVYE